MSERTTPLVKLNGVAVGRGRTFDFIEGSNVTITMSEDDSEVNITIAASGAAGAPSDVDYLVGTANATLTNEIVVGATPGGELGGTWAAPTVDATHSGSAHHAQSHGNADHTATFITATGVTYENLDANGDVGTSAGTVAIGNHTHAGGAPPAFFDVAKWGVD